MKKDAIISLRLNSELRDQMKEIASRERRSLSSLLEKIIVEFIERKNGAKGVEQDQRKYERKTFQVPAVVQTGSSLNNKGYYKTGKIKDISLGGLLLYVPKTEQIENILRGKSSYIEVLFHLPDEARPVSFECKVCRINDRNGDLEIGAEFSNVDFPSYQALQEYLL